MPVRVACPARPVADDWVFRPLFCRGQTRCPGKLSPFIQENSERLSSSSVWPLNRLG